MDVVHAQRPARHIGGGSQGDTLAALVAQVQARQQQDLNLREWITAEDGQPMRAGLALVFCGSRWAVHIIEAKRLRQLARAAVALGGVALDLLQKKEIGTPQVGVLLNALNQPRQVCSQVHIETYDANRCGCFHRG